VLLQTKYLAGFSGQAVRHALRTACPGGIEETGFCLAGALNEDSCQVLPIAHGEDGPEYDHHKSEWKSGWGHQGVEEKDVHDHRSKKHKREGHKAVCQEQQATDRLNAEDNHPVVGGEYGAKELGGQTRGRRHGKKVQEAVQTEDQKDQAQK
jgi:hypothetical protein